MIKSLSRLTSCLLLKQQCCLVFTNRYQMGLFTDKITQKQTKKAQQQFRKQIQYMANKPTFTYLDYKQRVTDQLNNLKGNIRKKMSQQAKDSQKLLNIQKRILNALFQEQLVGDSQITEQVKKQIAIISEVPIQKVKETITKAKSYKKMHKFLRAKQLKGQPLPESMGQLQYDFRQSRYQFQGKQRVYQRYKQQKKCKGHMRAVRIRYIKFKK